MLTQPQVQRYSTEAGLRDIMIAQKEVVLTFLLQLLSATSCRAKHEAGVWSSLRRHGEGHVTRQG